MKKTMITFAIILAFMLQLSVVSATNNGDINEDGKVNEKDLNLLNKICEDASNSGGAASLDTDDGKLTKKEKKLINRNGDLNGDGDKDCEDVVILNSLVLDGDIDLEDEQANLDDTYNNMNTETVSCGNKLVEGIPSSIPKVVHIVYIVIQIAVPVILVVLGMIDLLKAVIAGKEDEIKKHQMLFVKRLIAAALVFFVFVIVKLLISLVADTGGIIECADCFLNGVENCQVEK